MKLVFEGTPEQVLKDMKEYVARNAMEYGDTEDDPQLDHLRESLTTMVAAHPCDVGGSCHCPTCVAKHALACTSGRTRSGTSAPEPTPKVEKAPVRVLPRDKYDDRGIAIMEEKPSGESQAQPTPKDPVCSFCAKYSNASKPRVLNHEKHCKSNPNRVPHPKEGKPMNPALKAWQDKQREAKNSLPKDLPASLD